MQPVVDHNVTEADFKQRVIARSAQVPVVVDFWAPWCQPCLMLGPILERLEASANGEWELVKIDIDREPAIARQFRIQSIPAVKGFRDGQVVAEFLGALPEAKVRAFLRTVVPSTADKLAAQAESALQAGDDVKAEDLLRSALSEQSDHLKALLSLGSLLMRVGNVDEAAPLLERIPIGTPEGRDAQPLLGHVRLLRAAASVASDASDRTNLAANPDDPEAHWAAGTRAAAEGKYRAALDHFLWLAQNKRDYHEDGGRRSMLAVFDILGPDDPLSIEYRRKLASALY